MRLFTCLSLVCLFYSGVMEQNENKLDYIFEFSKSYSALVLSVVPL